MTQVLLCFIRLTALLTFLLTELEQSSLVAAADEPFRMSARSRQAVADPVEAAVRDSDGISEREVIWNPRETAIVICDMWDQHWCASATRRVGEMAPAMNQLIDAARSQGALIIHAPSDCMQAYAGTHQRQRAERAPVAANSPTDLDKGCSLLPGEPAMPVDSSDGGCDCVPQCRQGSPWRREIAALSIGDEDAITDSGREIWNLAAERGIQNFLVLGVHTNMCVVGRSFGLRQWARQGRNVLLVRDLTDTMYNPRRAPEVAHRRGTDLVLAHIESHICPTVAAADVIGEPIAPHVVFMIGEDEYDTKDTLPAFSQSELVPRGIRATYVHSDPEQPNVFPGLDALKSADLLLLSVRRRVPSPDQIAIVREYLASGRPVVGIRTASHPFETRDENGPAAWRHFDREVLGGDYLGHYGNKAPEGPLSQIRVLPQPFAHPLLAGIGVEKFEAPSHLYKCRDLGPAARLLMNGRVGTEPPDEAVAWTNNFRGSRVFYTSLGSPADFELPVFRRLLVNAIYWGLERAQPGVTATASAAR